MRIMFTSNYVTVASLMVTFAQRRHHSAVLNQGYFHCLRSVYGVGSAQRQSDVMEVGEDVPEMNIETGRKTKWCRVKINSRYGGCISCLGGAGVVYWGYMLRQ